MFFRHRILSLVLLFSMLSSSMAFAASPTRCEILLLSPEQIEGQIVDSFTDYRKDAPLLQRMIMRMRKKVMKKRILERCESQGGCTKEELARFIGDTLTDMVGSSKRLKKGIGYGIVASAISIAQPYITAGLPHTIKGLSRVLDVAVVVSVVVLIEPIKSSWKQYLERQTKKKIMEKAKDQTQDDNNRGLENLNGRTEVYTEAGLKATTRMSQYLGDLVGPTLKRVDDLLLSGDAKINHKKAVNAFIELAMQSRTLYNELYNGTAPINIEAVSTAMYMGFVINQDPASLKQWKDEVFKGLKRHDSEFAGPSVERYYRDMLDVWFDLPGPSHSQESKDDGYDGEI